MDSEPRYCESCCNFDREHTDMGGIADCLLTNVPTYAEACCNDCHYYNVPYKQVQELAFGVGKEQYGIYRNYA